MRTIPPGYPGLLCRSPIVDRRQFARTHAAAADGPLKRVIDRFAESEDAVLFARFNEVDKCEFIKMNAPEDAWASTDDGAGLLVKADALREQAREVLVSAASSRTSSLPQPAMGHHLLQLSPPLRVLALTTISPKVAATAFGITTAAP